MTTTEARFLKIIVLTLFLPLYISATAQDFSPKRDSSAQVLGLVSELPPLQEVIDSALVNSPLLKEQDAGIRIKEIELARSKSMWLDYVYLYGDAKYGSVDNFVYTGSPGSVGQVTSTLVTTRYNAGFLINISIFDMIDQKKQNKIARENLNIAKNKYDDVENKLREEVIMRYNRLLLSRNILLLSIDDRDAKFSSVELARKQLRSAEINIYEFSTIEDKYNRALQDFEIAKHNLAVAHALLEEIIGIKLDRFKK